MSGVSWPRNRTEPRSSLVYSNSVSWRHMTSHATVNYVTKLSTSTDIDLAEWTLLSVDLFGLITDRQTVPVGLLWHNRKVEAHKVLRHYTHICPPHILYLSTPDTELRGHLWSPWPRNYTYMSVLTLSVVTVWQSQQHTLLIFRVRPCTRRETRVYRIVLFCSLIIVSGKTVVYFVVGDWLFMTSSSSSMYFSRCVSRLVSKGVSSVKSSPLLTRVLQNQEVTQIICVLHITWSWTVRLYQITNYIQKKASSSKGRKRLPHHNITI